MPHSSQIQKLFNNARERAPNVVCQHALFSSFSPNPLRTFDEFSHRKIDFCLGKPAEKIFVLDYFSKSCAWTSGNRQNPRNKRIAFSESFWTSDVKKRRKSLIKSTFIITAVRWYKMRSISRFRKNLGLRISETSFFSLDLNEV